MSIPPRITDLTPESLRAALQSGEILLIDVREPYEFEAERISGALNYPLSSFDATALPSAPGKRLVLSCAGGVRSVSAFHACQMAGVEVSEHLGGGLRAWKAAGLPTES